jgi:hypothetical protein
MALWCESWHELSAALRAYRLIGFNEKRNKAVIVYMLVPLRCCENVCSFVLTTCCASMYYSKRRSSVRSRYTNSMIEHTFDTHRSRHLFSPTERSAKKELPKGRHMGVEYLHEGVPESLKRSMHFLKQVFCILQHSRHKINRGNKQSEEIVTGGTCQKQPLSRRGQPASGIPHLTVRP